MRSLWKLVEADGDGEGGPDGGAPRPARRAGQARRLRGRQGRREVQQERQEVGTIWKGLTSSFECSLQSFYVNNVEKPLRYLGSV